MINNNNSSFNLREKSLRRVRLKSREDFLNVFTPASPIHDPEKFVGRQNQLDDMITALLSKGADLIVYGERGCGKSSIAYMLHNISQGDFELLDYYNLRDRLEEKGFLSWLIGPDKKIFNVIWVNGFKKTLDQVMHAVLTRRREKINERVFGPGLLSYLPSEADQKEVATKIGFNKIFVGENQVKEIHIPEKPINIKEGFELAIQQYANSHEDQLLIIIDEFETIENRSEIAFYMKNIPNVRFVLVGIAETVFDLIGQHSSISRQAHAIKLEPMSEDELREILTVGTFLLKKQCIYKEKVIDGIVSNCFRSPYWCHFLAKALLQNHLESQERFENFLRAMKPVVFSQDKLLHILCSLGDNAECRLYEEQFSALVLGDEINQKVLVSIAEEKDTLIISKRIVDSLSHRTQISSNIIKETIEDFLNMHGSPFEVKSKIRNNFSFTFRDSNFKRYILIRDRNPQENDKQ